MTFPFEIELSRLHRNTRRQAGESAPRGAKAAPAGARDSGKSGARRRAGQVVWPAIDARRRRRCPDHRRNDRFTPLLKGDGDGRTIAQRGGIECSAVVLDIGRGKQGEEVSMLRRAVMVFLAVRVRDPMRMPRHLSDAQRQCEHNQHGGSTRQAS